MQDFEKLGSFYLGREFDPDQGELEENLLLYDSKDLVTHAVCIGMTGSGKTGLCIDLLEEAAIDGIPAIVVDPKGDLSNLLLTFPELRGSEFLPWVNREEARRKELSLEAFAGQQASLWKKGLSEWGQDGNRIHRLKEAADFAIFTPGSSAGIPVSILNSFSAPGPRILEDGDLLRERINSTVTSLLDLIGLDPDPIQSREHILLSTILNYSWLRGEDLDLKTFIEAIQTPPVNRIGVFNLESFFSAKERFAFAMKINNLLAAPGFASWLEGAPLDIDSFYRTPEGKPRISIFSIAHLGDSERMFFVSLLLTQLVGWMRGQTGTGSLRSLFYMDEIFGYFPPVANPPSKKPLLTLLKQARAYGLGVVLATQNPVDLDYKGLSNTGTWFIGRLQTEQDRDRVLDGLQGAGSSEGGRFERSRMEKILANLGKRVFLMNNIHEDEPVCFKTRWAMSYLRGPLARGQIKELMKSRKADFLPEQTSPGPASSGTPAVTIGREAANASAPVLPPHIPCAYLPLLHEPEGKASLIYRPMLSGVGEILFADSGSGFSDARSFSLLAGLSGSRSEVDWDDADETDMVEEDHDRHPEEDALFDDLPPWVARRRGVSSWKKSLVDWLYRHRTIELLRSPSLKLVSRAGETEREFRIRLQETAHEKRDEMTEKIKKRYSRRITTLENRLNNLMAALDREKEQASQQKLQTAISVGATFLSALLGRKKVSRTTLGRATTSARGAGRVMKERMDVKRAEEKIEYTKQRILELENEILDEIEQVREAIDPLTEELEPVRVRPKKKDIDIQSITLVWAPFWMDKKGILTRAWE